MTFLAGAALVIGMYVAMALFVAAVGFLAWLLLSEWLHSRRARAAAALNSGPEAAPELEPAVVGRLVA